jgi:hypothetical protein
MSDFHNYISSDLQTSNMRLEEEVRKLKEVYISVSTAYVGMIEERDKWKEVASGLYNGSIHADIRWKGDAISTVDIFRKASELYQELMSK